jgi:Tol biopolymer transport system component
VSGGHPRVTVEITRVIRAERVDFAAGGLGPSGGTSLAIVNSDESSDVVVLSDRYENFVGGWSPDGRRLAFSSNRRGDLDVYTIGTDGKGIRRVVGGPGAQAVNAWLPDGRLVFADSPPDEQTSDWKTVHPDGSNLRRLTFLAGAADPIDWRAAPTAEAR